MLTFKEMTYEMSEVRKYEDYVIKFLSFKLSYFTTYNILEYLILNGTVFSNEINITDQIYVKDKLRRLNKTAFIVLSNIVEDSNYVNFNHIELAFSCLVFAREVMKLKVPFHTEFERIYNLKQGNIQRCYQYVSM